ncbi:branched-chain amino acid ABC transporter permease [Nocardiopsis ansamitocini]|uniref:Branched-chain amino acid ABC transporter permease n=1 Tax=Nocardiopsis ansamitocini TaxID=1670832 RepID=A0A9W6P2M4_9ACTN|nr:branched-chain amino acid ABC transporter permease [Nocardiopsis ansamitocini]GLU45908.1 hypothetical protein Nans01_02590 [Nocardiopsis ansamitocini]
MRKRLVTLLLAVIAVILAVPGAASADTPGGESLVVTLTDPAKSPVEGVLLTAYKGEEEIGSDSTDSDGEWRVEVPGPGSDYRVVLDPETLPDGVDVNEQAYERAPLRPVTEGQEARLLFRLVPEAEATQAPEEPSPSAETDGAAGADDGAVDDSADGAAAETGVSAGTPFGVAALQLSVSGLIFGLIIAISAIGLSLIFGTTRMTNFAHGDMVTFGAMMALMFSTGTIFGGIPLIIAAVLAVLAGALLGLGMEWFIWKPLRKRNVALIQMFIVSIGFALLIRHIITVAFGANRMRYNEYQIQQPIHIGPVSIVPRDLIIMGIAILVLILVGVMLQYTRIGKAMRAVSDNRDLAESSGINVDRITLYVWGLSGALSALGGVLYGLNQTVDWQMGFRLLLLMFAAVILGGLGTAYGAMVGGIVVGLVAMLSTLWFPTELMNAWALGIMIVVLLVRPQGILGRRERVG